MSEDHGYIPYLAPPSRPLPAGFVAAEYGGTNGGVVCGDLVLIPKKNAWGGSYAVEAAYRWQNGAWQAGVPWLPTDRWPSQARHGFLVYLRTDPATNDEYRDIVDSATGEVKWSVDDWNWSADGFDVNEHALVVDGEQGVTVYPLGGTPRNIPTTWAHRMLLDGRELAIFSQTDWSLKQVKLERWSIDTGELLGAWTLTGDYELFAFHGGKALVGKEHNFGHQVELLVPGNPEPRVLVLPEAVQPRSRVVPTNEIEVPPLGARTPTGVWLTLGTDWNARDRTLHCDLSGDEPAWSLAIDGVPAYNNGYRIVTQDGSSAPMLSNADPAILPTAFFLPARGRELSGVLPVKVRLDRPSAATVRVRVASRNGGTATPGADFTVFDQWLTFPPGTMEAEASLSLTEDFLPEPHETVPLEITAVENANEPVTPRVIGVIEGSGVQKSLVSYPNVPANPGAMASSITGGDGLAYRSVSVLAPYSGLPSNRIEVSDPLTGAVLETVALRADPRILPPSDVWFGTNYLGQPYSVGGALTMRATPDGVICRYASNYPTPLEWKLSGQRTYPACTVRFGNPVEGGAAGLLELQACERTTAPGSVHLSLTTRTLRELEINSSYPFSMITPANIEVPADGSVRNFDLPFLPDGWTWRNHPIRMLLHDGAGMLLEDTYIEPAPGDYDPAKTIVPLDPVLADKGVGHFVRRGDSLWVAFGDAVNPTTKSATGCVQELDPATYQVKRTIWAPAAIKHPGFGELLVDAGDDLIIVASHIDDSKRKHKALRTICVLNVASGTYRAIIPWKYWERPAIDFDDNYLAISSMSYDDGDDRWAGGVALYRRSDYKLAGSAKFAGPRTGQNVALAGGSLWVTMPAAAWRPAGIPKRDPGQPNAGAILRFRSLPSLKTYDIIQSPEVRMQPDVFGRSLDRAEDGTLVVGSFNGMFRIDPTGVAPIQRAPELLKLLPATGYSRGAGLRADFYHRIFDESTGLTLADFYDNGRNAITDDTFLYASAGILFAVPLDRCGSFEMWQRFAPEIPGDTRPDIQRYVEEHLGALPEVTATPKYGGYNSKVIVSISAPLPPDVTMLVEYSIGGGPWQLAALRHGLGPVRNPIGEATKDLPNQVETLDDLPARGIRFRARYDRTTAMPLSFSEYRHHYVKP